MASVLRYPYEAITETTDYLQIYSEKYVAAREPLVRRPGSLNSLNTNFSSKGKTYENGMAVTLPMPSNIQDGNSVKYADDSLNGYLASAVSMTKDSMNIDISNLQQSVTDAVSKIGTKFNTEFNNSPTRDIVLKALAAQAVNVFGGNVSVEQLLARSTGDIFNPNMELLFNGVTLRTFKFSFKMTPRSKREAEEVRDIIKSFKKTMSPKTGLNDKFIRTPDIFNLEYRKGDKPHPFLHRFKKCALTDMNVNYTGENIYATYPEGEPVSMIMDLTFRELEPVYDSDYTGDGSIGVGF